MSIFRIQGGTKLNGAITVSGNKNAATPLIAATLLSSDVSTLRNVPKIQDVLRIIDLIERLGAKIQWKDGHTLRVDPSSITPDRLRDDQVRKDIKSMRSSVLLLAPLLIRFGSVRLPEPGGCIIGKRPLDTHFHALRSLGAQIEPNDHDGYTLTAKALTGSSIILPEFSVTATENVVMAAVMAKGTTRVSIAAQEPHVVQLCETLCAMGAAISGVGTHTLLIEGVDRLSGMDVTVMPDHVEAATLALAAVLTNGTLDISPVRTDDLLLPMQVLESAGVHSEVNADHWIVCPPHRLTSLKVKALPAPGFPTDLQSPFGVLATQCQGTSLIHDPLYEGRLGYINELIKMGANAIVCDPHRVLITGPTPLVGTEVQSLDLRSGATMLLAGLLAQGQTLIHHAEILDRGYERIHERLNAVGASIQREDN